MDKLIVKNFGPLKDVEIELNKINLFIGENGSGKSVLAKLVTILTNYLKLDNDYFLKAIDDFKINFITNETIIRLYSNNNNYIELENGKFVFPSGTIREIGDYKRFDNFFSEELKSLPKANRTKDEEISFDNLTKQLERSKKLDLLFTSQYIPAERNFISLFNKSLSTLLVADVPLPKFLLQFSSEFEKAGNTIKELNVLNVRYVNTDSQNRHKIYYSDNESLDLSESSSGIQSAIPLYLTVKYLSEKHHAIIIEEPEQNLFPKAQKETVEFIVEQRQDDNALFMMTHSPYILTSLNNLILANDVKEQKGLDAIKGIVDEKHCVAFEDVSAYSIEGGKAIDIMDKEDRLIGVNVIDGISDEVSHTFDTLLSKLD